MRQIARRGVFKALTKDLIARRAFAQTQSGRAASLPGSAERRTRFTHTPKPMVKARNRARNAMAKQSRKANR